MQITKHGFMRFKQRQKIKNSGEMKRKVTFAVTRGKPINGISSSPDIMCYLFDGFYYLVSNNGKLITVFRPHKAKTKEKRLLLDDIRIREFNNELRYSFSSVNECIA